MIPQRCSTCGGPIFRDDEDNFWITTVVGRCRLCWLEAVASGAQCFERQPFEWNTPDNDPRGLGDHERWAANNDERDGWRGLSFLANCPDPAATSDWLPRVWVNDETRYTVTRERGNWGETRQVPNAAAFVDGIEPDGPVVWFRRIDTPDPAQDIAANLIRILLKPE